MLPRLEPQGIGTDGSPLWSKVVDNQCSKAEYAELLSLGRAEEQVKGERAGKGLSVDCSIPLKQVHPATLCACLAYLGSFL